VCKKSRGERLQVKGEKQTKQVSSIAKRAAMQSEGGYVDLHYVDLHLTGEGGRRMVSA
jgi:hypothetical protein